MKKIYFLAIAFIAFSLSGNAQLIDENFDALNLVDDISTQSSDFTNWSGPSGTTEDAFVTDAQGNGGNSLLISNNTTSDVLLLLGNNIGGLYTLQFDYYVTDGATGFYGILETDDTSSPTFTTTVYTNAGGSGTDEIRDGSNAVIGTFILPKDVWVTMTHVMNLDTNTLQILMNGAEIYNGSYGSAGGFLGSVDLWSVDASCENYFDNILFVNGTLGVDEFAVDEFSVYPNPVQDILNIKSSTVIETVVVYDILGKVVLQAQPNKISPSLDVSTLSSGAYLVKISNGTSAKTLKIIK